MKNIYLIFSIIFFASCKAQILDAYDVNILSGDINGAYYKDLTNFRDQFVGTWVYSQGNTSLTIQLQKRDNLFNDNGFKTFYEDIMVGEYRYIENGIEKINTLSNININYGNTFENNTKHNLLGDMFLLFPYNFPSCSECLSNEKRMVFDYTEPNYDAKGVANGYMVVRYFVENGVEKIKIVFYTENQVLFVDSNDNPIDNPEPYKIPFGEYVLVKQ